MTPSSHPSKGAARRLTVIAAVICTAIISLNCGKKSSEPTATQSSQSQPTHAQQAAMQLTPVNLSAAGLDELLAPIALYPDPVLAVMLQASTNPQEVMDGGNWLALDQNQNLKEAALDEASKKAGFTPVTQALLHYPTVVDLMCSQFDWTKQLGAAYQEDPKSVLASVQRLRAQAVDNNALKSSPQMKVEVKKDEEGEQVVALEPANPKVIYVPQYNPDQAFQSAPTNTNATTTTTTAPATTSTTTVVKEESGVSEGTAALIGVLSFGAGIALGAAINNDNYYYPAWGAGGVYYGARPYYPPPYRPAYYGGWNGGYAYNRPVHYGNTNVNINNNYYNRFNNNRNLNSNYRPNQIRYNNRPNGTLANNMGYQSRYRNSGATYNRSTAANNASNFRGQSTYQGRANTTNLQNRTGTAAANPRVNGTGATAANRNVDRAATTQARTQASQTPRTPASDRGFGTQTTRQNAGNLQGSRQTVETARASNPGAISQPTSTRSEGQFSNRTQQASATREASGSREGAFSGAGNARADRAASDRGRSSMGSGSRQSSGGRRR